MPYSLYATVIASHSVIAGLTGNLHKVAPLCSELLVKLTCSNHHVLILSKTSCGGLHDGECFRKKLIQNYFDGLVFVFDQLVALCCEGFFLFNGDISFQLLLDFRYAVFERFFYSGYLFTKGLAVGTELVVGEFVYIGIKLQDFIQDRTQDFHVPVALGAEDLFQYVTYCHKMLFSLILQSYKLCLDYTNIIPRTRADKLTVQRYSSLCARTAGSCRQIVRKYLSGSRLRYFMPFTSVNAQTNRKRSQRGRFTSQSLTSDPV